MINEHPAQQETRPTTPEPSSGRLQVLATEHWSLLATRSLTYMESFSRVSMFLTVLTGAVVALALFAQVDHFHGTFQMAAILILTVVVFVGLVTVGRVSTLNRENFQLVAGMNRLRRAYLEAYPDVEPYFTAGSHDDFRGFQLTMSLPDLAKPSPMTKVTQGFQTLPAMLGVIVSLVAGLLGAIVAASFGASSTISVVVAAVIFSLLNVLLAVVSQRAFFGFVRAAPARFPSPVESPRP
jgi:ABC-type transport system involved in cytochrome bd biosynthesis fused ATPase/permease subunit